MIIFALFLFPLYLMYDCAMKWNRWTWNDAQSTTIKAQCSKMEEIGMVENERQTRSLEYEITKNKRRYRRI